MAYLALLAFLVFVVIVQLIDFNFYFSFEYFLDNKCQNFQTFVYLVRLEFE